MTSTWDAVQILIIALGRLKDPDIYATGLRYLSNLFAEIHEYDHQHNEKISNALYFKSAMNDINKLLRGVKP